MNLQRRPFSDQHRNTAHLTKFQRDLNIRGQESVFDGTSFWFIALDYFLERVGNPEQACRKLLARRGANDAAFKQAVAAAFTFDDAPPRGLTARINSQNA